MPKGRQIIASNRLLEQRFNQGLAFRFEELTKILPGLKDSKKGELDSIIAGLFNDFPNSLGLRAINYTVHENISDYIRLENKQIYVVDKRIVVADLSKTGSNNRYHFISFLGEQRRVIQMYGRFINYAKAEENRILKH